MSWFEAVVLGIVQGLTEFIPISSSAHLRIVAALAGWSDPGAAFTAVIQIGTELAVLAYFWKKIVAILRAWFFSLFKSEYRSDPDARMGWLIIVGTLPIGVLGVLFQDDIKSVFRDLRLIGIVFIVFGILLAVADRYGQREKDLDHLTVRDGLLFGLAQALALIPGVSRSGGTITGGRALGYRREDAAEYSFLLAVPAVFASGIFELKDIGSGGTSWGPTIIATILSFVVGFAVIAWLMKYIKTHSFMPFVIYRVIVGAILLVLVFSGILSPTAGPVV